MEGREIKAETSSLYFYSLIVAIIFEVGSLCFIGIDPLFTYGLALGTAIAIVNYNFLRFTSGLALVKGKGISFVLLGYIIRLSIYGGTFLISYRSGAAGGIATLLGFISFKIALYYSYGIKPGLTSRKYDKLKLNNLDEDQWSIERNSKVGLTDRLFAKFHYKAN